MTLTTYKWSIEEWHELVNSGLLEGKPVEFLEGEIVVRWSAPTRIFDSPVAELRTEQSSVLANPQSGLSPEGIEHSYTNRSVVKYLRQLLDRKAEVIQAQPITLDNSEPEPDIAVVRLPETIYKDHHPYPQDIYWLIEVSNTILQKDLKQKIATYARNGIPEYWVIDLVNKKLITHTQRQNNSYSQVVEYQTGTVSPLAFPSIAIAKLAEGIALDQLLLF